MGKRELGMENWEWVRNKAINKAISRNKYTGGVVV